MKNKETKITRGTIRLIKKAIEETKSSNRYVLCHFIAEELESKFKYDLFDYQVKRMGLETTGQILEVVDIYLIKYADKKE